MALYVRTGNGGGDAAYMVNDLGFQVPTGASWTELTDQFTAVELRDSDDLTSAIQGGNLECSTDGSTNDVSAGDYDADLALVLELNLREISEEENNEYLVDGSVGDTLHVHNASGVNVVGSYSNIGDPSTLEELASGIDSEIGTLSTDLSAHLDGGANKHDASEIDVEGTYANITGTPGDLETTISGIDTRLGALVASDAYSTIQGNTGSATASGASDTLLFSGTNGINTTAADGSPDSLTIDGTALVPRDGSRSMTGDLNMGAWSITNVNLVDGVDVSALDSTVSSHTGDSSIHFTEGSIDHGSISGLGDDDHTQYVSLTDDGNRNAMTGKLNLASGELRLPQAADITSAFPSAEEGDLAWDTDDEALYAHDGTQWFAIAPASGIITDHGGLTGLGDDDHPQYTAWADTETISGVWTFAEGPIFEDEGSAPAGTAGKVINVGGIMYIYDGTRSKWLSLQHMHLAAGRNSALATNVYMRVVNDIPSNQTGYRMLRDGTITGLAAQTNGSESWTFEVRRNGSAIASLVISAATGGQDATIDVDFSAGDELQFYVNGTAINKPVGVVEYAWRV